MTKTFMIPLQWKTFNVNLSAIDADMKAKFPSSYLGNQAHKQLELWFNIDPNVVPNGGQSIAQQVNAWWTAIESSSSEATSYQTRAQIAAAAAATKAAAIATATSKLEALGLTSAEIAAITGG